MVSIKVRKAYLGRCRAQLRTHSRRRRRRDGKSSERRVGSEFERSSHAASQQWPKHTRRYSHDLRTGRLPLLQSR